MKTVRPYNLQVLVLTVIVLCSSLVKALDFAIVKQFQPGKEWKGEQNVITLNRDSEVGRRKISLIVLDSGRVNLHIDGLYINHPGAPNIPEQNIMDVEGIFEMDRDNRPILKINSRARTFLFKISEDGKVVMEDYVVKQVRHEKTHLTIGP
ncbi:MAG: hypothetical protein AB9873_13255 [Syntrophobacteraceae bacterium]